MYVRYGGPHTLNLYRLDTVNKRLGNGSSDVIIKSDDPDFDISTIPMGYYQYEGNRVCYVTRRPQRLYKQGVSADALTFQNLTNNFISASCFSKPFENMVLGNFTSLEQAYKIFQKSQEQDCEIAISRDAALKLNHKIRIISVFYKNDEVGWLQEGSDTVIVPTSEKGWLVSKFLSQFNWRVQ